jgi:hypothetical protein
MDGGVKPRTRREGSTSFGEAKPGSDFFYPGHGCSSGHSNGPKYQAFFGSFLQKGTASFELLALVGGDGFEPPALSV